MSNNNAPYGFLPVRNYYGAAPTYQTSMRQILSTNANSFGKGDVVKSLSSGYIDRALTSDNQVLGVLDRIEYFDTFLNKKIYANAWLAPTTALAGSVIAYVIDDPQCLFQVQSGNGGPVTIASVGNNIKFAGNAAPSTYSQLSIAYADFGNIGTTSTYPFRIVDVPQNLSGIPLTASTIGNDSTAQYNQIIVRLNSCDALATTGI